MSASDTMVNLNAAHNYRRFLEDFPNMVTPIRPK